MRVPPVDRLAVTVVVENEGPRVRLRRLSGDATSFFGPEGEGWRRMAEEEVRAVEPGTPVCVESLLDGQTYLAIRVFVGAACGPAT